MTRRYPAYRDSGVEWLGEVPVGWDVVPVAKVAEVVNGYPFDSKLFDTATGTPLIRIRDLNATESESRYTGEIVERALVSSNDVLVGMDGDFNVGRWLGAEPALLNQRMCCIRGVSVEVTRLLEYLLPVPLKLINDVTYSTTVKHLSSSQIEKCRVCIPPSKGERLAILAFLDQETAKIDALVAEQRRLIDLLKEKRQAVISHAVTRGLNPAAKLKPSGVDWLGDVPEGWEIVPLKRVATIQTGVAKGKDTTGIETVEVPYLRVANVQDGYVDLTDISVINLPAESLNRYLLKRGDVLMNEGGDFDKLGRGCIWNGEIDPCIHQNHVFAVRPYGVSSEWLNAITSSDYAQFFFMGRSKQSTNLASISSSNLMELPIVVPPPAEQKAIIAFIEQQSAKLKELSTDAEAAINLLQERRAALISAAVTGKIDVRENMTDEVAA